MKKEITYEKKNRMLDITLHVILICLLLLWIPVVIDKVVNFKAFTSSIINQPFSDQLGYFLTYALPVLESSTIVMLLSKKLRMAGLILSTTLMMVFTGYIAAALLGAWDSLPCGCGSVISGMNWMEHFFFNLFFLALSTVGLIICLKLRGSITGREAVKGWPAKRHHNSFS